MILEQGIFPLRKVPAILSPKSSAGRSLRACHHDALLSLRGAHDISAEALLNTRGIAGGYPPHPPSSFSPAARAGFVS